MVKLLLQGSTSLRTSESALLIIAIFVLPDSYFHLVRKRQLISKHIKGPLDAAIRSPLMKALDRSVKTLGL